MPRFPPTRDSLIGVATLRAITPAAEGGRKPGVRDWMRASKLAAQAVTLPVMLAIAHEQGAGTDGGWPTQLEYAEWFRMSERSAQREWATFRRVFGPEVDVYDVAQRIYANYRVRLREQDASVAYDVPAALVAPLLAAAA
jgi:hypothetical protein